MNGDFLHKASHSLTAGVPKEKKVFSFTKLVYEFKNGVAWRINLVRHKLLQVFRRVRLPPTPLMKKPEEKNVKCPWCGRKKAVEKHEDDENVYYCKHCNRLFDLRKEG